MIRFGACLPYTLIGDAAKAGFDYIECNLSEVSAMSDAEFEAAREAVDAAPIKAEAFNVMLPARLKLTGPEVNHGEIRAYLEKSLARARTLGGKVIVFGSGGARGVPDGFPMDRAWRQIADYLRLLEPVAAANGIDIAIEPLRRQECNILNLVTEATALAALLELPHIGALGDSFHMEQTHEPFIALTYAGKLLKHVHTSHTLPDCKRDYPSPGDGVDYPAMFRALKAAGYDRRVSIEAGYKDLLADGAAALSVLRAARDGK